MGSRLFREIFLLLAGEKALEVSAPPVEWFEVNSSSPPGNGNDILSTKTLTPLPATAFYSYLPVG